jgi:hypothetical protein
VSLASAARRRGVVAAAALVLAGTTIGAAVRSRFVTIPKTHEQVLMERLCRSLLALQLPDGDYDRVPGEKDEDPEVKRTTATAVATVALLRARRLGADVPGLDRAIALGLDRLRLRQDPAKGGFGALPAGFQTSPWPALQVLSAALIALSMAHRPGDADAIDKGAKAYTNAVAYGADHGWTRGLAAIAAETMFREGDGERFGVPVTELVREVREDSDRVDCGDFRLAEAIARVIRAGGGAPPFSAEILAACLKDPEFPKWSGDSTDLQSWWLQAWLAARLPGGEEWFRRVVPAIETAIAPLGRVPRGWYADTVTQTACAVLVLAEQRDREPR